MRKRILSIFLSICIIATLSISAPVSAVSIPDPNTDLSLGNVVIDSDGTYTITQSEDGTTSNTITINSNATVYLDGVNIEADAPTSTSDFSRTNPININGDYTVNLYLVDGSQNTLASKEGIGGISTTNPITSGSAKAALRVPAGATLNIYGDTGVLDATGAQAHNNSDSNAHGGGGAGIGGNGGISHSPNGSQAESSGTINIYGGIINATGGETTGYWGEGGSGIGSGGKRFIGDEGVSGPVIIHGGTVTATGGNGGNSSTSGFAIGGNLTINDGRIMAVSASVGANIRSPLSTQPELTCDYQWRLEQSESLNLSSVTAYSHNNNQRYVEIKVLPRAAYTINHYKETLEGSYTLADTDNLTGAASTSASAIAKTYPGYSENITHESRIISGTINADGSTVLKLYYDRNEYSLRFVNHDGSVLAAEEVKYDDYIESPEIPVRPYHVFAGWFTDNGTFSYEWVFADNQVTADIILYAKWAKIPQSITRISVDEQSKITVDGLINMVNLPEKELENTADIFVFVKADPIQISESIQDKVQSEIDRKGLKLLSVFDIGLYKRITTYEGVTTETSISNDDILGKITVRIPLTEEQSKKDNLAIAFIDDDGNVTIIAGKIITESEVKYIEFETDHFSTYSIVEISIVDLPVTGEKTDSKMILGFLALLFAMGVLIMTKRKLLKEEIE